MTLPAPTKLTRRYLLDFTWRAAVFLLILYIYLRERAALDVTVPEPLNADSPLWDIPNLLLTPHLAGGIRLEVSRRNAVDFALANFRRYAGGQPLQAVARAGMAP